MKLYKYSAVDENCLSGLINSQLWFSDSRSFNDPFDVDLDNYYKDRLVEVDEKLIEINEIIKECQANNLTDEVIQVISKKESTLKLTENHKNEILDDGHSHFGILCLTKNKGESNTLMWSHYGNSHKGVMLEFETDADATFFELPCHLIYKKNIHLLEEMLLKKYGENILDYIFIFLLKAPQWEYEQEVRVVKTKIKNNQRLFKYDPNCLTGIYFGLKTTEEHKQTIKQIILLKGLTETKLYQAKKVEDSFNLVYTEV